MAIRMKVSTCVAIACLLFAGRVHADPCDDFFAKGSAVFEQAVAAGEKKDYAGAVRLYQAAEQYYKQIAAASGCSNQQLRVTAGKNAGICRSNMKKIQMAMDRVNNYNRETAASGVYDQATAEYNRGVEAFNKQDWDAASDALESAAAIWDGISSGTTRTEKMAALYAVKARKMADQARRNKWK